MSDNIVLHFALWFGSVVALICAVYVALGMAKKKREQTQEQY